MAMLLALVMFTNQAIYSDTYKSAHTGAQTSCKGAVSVASEESNGQPGSENFKRIDIPGPKRQKR